MAAVGSDGSAATGSGLRLRPLGKSGLWVTELGLGAMDTPTSPEGKRTIERALELGVRLIDTAREYAGSEQLIGTVLRKRSVPDLVISTKTFKRRSDAAQWEVYRSLEVLGVERIGLYQLHDVSTWEAWKEVTAPGGALDGLREARELGLIQAIGASIHDLDVAREAILSGAFDALMLEYSAFYPRSADLIELARERGVGVLVMRPLGGSGRTSVIRQRVAAGLAGPLTPANLLRYVLSHPGVSAAVPGARYPERVEENVAVARTWEPMSEEERRELERAAAELY